jgi:hypothetical protein
MKIHRIVARAAVYTLAASRREISKTESVVCSSRSS